MGVPLCANNLNSWTYLFNPRLYRTRTNTDTKFLIKLIIGNSGWVFAKIILEVFGWFFFEFIELSDPAGSWLRQRASLTKPCQRKFLACFNLRLLPPTLWRFSIRWYQSKTSLLCSSSPICSIKFHTPSWPSPRQVIFLLRGCRSIQFSKPWLSWKNAIPARSWIFTAL